MRILLGPDGKKYLGLEYDVNDYYEAENQLDELRNRVGSPATVMDEALGKRVREDARYRCESIGFALTQGQLEAINQLCLKMLRTGIAMGETGPLVDPTLHMEGFVDITGAERPTACA